MTEARPTAGVVIIGSEILNGKVADENSAFLVARLRRLGVELRQIAVVGDEIEEIAEVVTRFSGRYDIVCTTGGIGPTHDDRTMDAVAHAFGLEIVEAPELVTLMEQRLGERMSQQHRRMARVPTGTVLSTSEDGHWPAMRSRNVYIFPGMPHLLRLAFTPAAREIHGSETWLTHLDLDAFETEICERLDSVVAEHREVEIGSYPRFDGARWTVRLTAEGIDATRVEEARTALTATFGGLVLATSPVRSSAETDDTEIGDE